MLHGDVVDLSAVELDLLMPLLKAEILKQLDHVIGVGDIGQDQRTEAGDFHHYSSRSMIVLLALS